MNRNLLDEYKAIRNSAGFIDLSKDTKISISGKGSESFLGRLASGNIESMREGKIVNTLFMRENGAILAIVWLLKDDDRFLILTDAEKREVLIDWLMMNSSGANVRIEDRTADLGCIAVAGPKAQVITRTVAGDDIVGLPYLTFEHNSVSDSLLCRIGYSGEYEYRFLAPHDKLAILADSIIANGSEYGLVRCGAKVLDTLMIEMKSVNQKSDIYDNTTPIQAGLHWMVDFRKDEFVGKEVIEIEKRLPPRKLLTLAFEDGNGVSKGGSLFIDDIKVGQIVNMAFSPTLNTHIGLAYIEERLAWVGIDMEAETESGGRTRTKTVSSPLFITKTVTEAS